MTNLFHRTSSLMYGFLLVLLMMAASVQPVAAADGTFTLGALRIKSSSASSDPLPAEEAFEFSGVTYNGKKLVMSWKIAPDYYLYRNKFKVRVLPAAGLEVGDLELPPGTSKEDEFYGTIHAVHQFADVTLPLTYDAKQATDLVVEVNWQGCAESLGICYPPVVKQFKTSLAAGKPVEGVIILDELPEDALVDITGKVPVKTPPVTDVPTVSEQDRIAKMLSGDNIFLVLLSFLGFGLLLSFTPCVFPMIPILSGIIAGQKDITPHKAFILSLVYVLAMALTYTIAGVLAGLFGSNLSAALQTPWVLSVFSAVFVLLSLSMFGFYELQVPRAIQTHLHGFSNKQTGGSMIGVAIMGVLSALIVGPCVAAPLAGALIYISLSGDAVLGGMALFALSLGMGIPLLLVGTLEGKLLPSAGTWMESVKSVFGVILLGVAIWMLERVLPTQIIMLLWALLIICSAVYMGAMTTLAKDATGWSKLWKGIGIFMLLYGGAVTIGAAAGGNDVLQPLKGVFGGASTSQQKPDFRRVDNLDELQQVLAESKGRTVMLDFYADWCVSCKEMEKYTFPDSAVREALSGMVLLKADVTANSAEHKAMMSHFGVIGPPAMLFFDVNGHERKEMRLVGFMPASTFAGHVRGAEALPAVP